MGNSWKYAAASGGIVNTTPVTIKAAAGAGIRNYISSLQISNGGVAGTEVFIRDGAGGPVLWRQWAPAVVPSAPIELKPAIFGSANTLLEVVLSSATTVAVYVNAQGYSDA